ncbi:MAG: aldehyde dehydrogenase family protein [Planctomycetota bacterium]
MTHDRGEAPRFPRPEAARWGNAALDDRLTWLRRFRRAVASDRVELCRLMEEEVGKPAHEALTGDILPLLSCCRWHDRHARAILRSRRVHGRAFWQLGQRHARSRAPLGTVGIIATWNYPVQLLGVQLVQALVAGNRVVVKPSEHAPRTQTRLLELAAAGLPPGVLRRVDATREAGPRLLQDHDLDHVVFTGSTAVGRSIAEWAADRLVPTTLELTGRDSAIVLDDADPALASAAIWRAVEMNGGQTCLAPRRALVTPAIYRRFLASLAPRAAGAAARRLISEAAARETFEQVEAAISSGGRSISGVVEPPRGARLVPLAVVDCPRDAALVAGHHFGPALAVVPVADMEDALAVHAACDQHLATSIFTKDTALVRRVAPRLRAGNVTINDVVLPTAHPATAFGGLGASGWGVTQGREGLVRMTRSVYVSRTSSWLRLPCDPPTRKVLSTMFALVGRLYGGGGRAEHGSATAGDVSSEPHPPDATRGTSRVASQGVLETHRHG